MRIEDPVQPIPHSRSDAMNFKQHLNQVAEELPSPGVQGHRRNQAG